jgi:hypothetical protein
MRSERFASDALAAIIMRRARTTIDIDPVVLRELKKRKRREGKTLGPLASELPVRAMRETESPNSRDLDWASRDPWVPASTSGTRRSSRSRFLRQRRREHRGIASSAACADRR